MPRNNAAANVRCEAGPWQMAKLRPRSMNGAESIRSPGFQVDQILTPPAFQVGAHR